MESHYELEDQRRSLVMPPPGSPGLDREDAVNLIRKLQDVLRTMAGLRAAQSSESGSPMPTALCARSLDPEISTGVAVAKTTGTVSLGDLIERGDLEADERIFINRRSAPPIAGIILSDGRIKVGQTISNTPSTAARLALAVGSVDGWIKWRVPRLDWKTLAEVREGVS
jgi:hypothetical protein